MPLRLLASLGKRARAQSFVRAWLRADGLLPLPVKGGWAFVDPATGEEREPLEGEPLAFAPDGRWARYSPPDVEPPVVLHRPDGATAALEAGPYGTTALHFVGRWAVRWDHTDNDAVHLHDADTGRRAATLYPPARPGAPHPPRDLEPGLDGRTLLEVSEGRLHLWDLEARRKGPGPELPAGVRATGARALPGGRLLIASDVRTLLLDARGRVEDSTPPELDGELLDVVPLGEGFVASGGWGKKTWLAHLGPDLALRERVPAGIEDGLTGLLPLPSGEGVLAGSSHGQVHHFGWGEPREAPAKARKPAKSKARRR